MEHLKDRITVEQLAEQALMSPRDFARIFTRETGVTSAKNLRHMRLEAAYRFLTETQLTLETISDECGLMNNRYFAQIVYKIPKGYTV